MGLADVIKNLVMKADENAENFLHGKKADNTDTYNFVGLPAQDGSDKVVAEIGVSKNPRTGGFIEGFQENKNTPLSVLDNWGTPRPLNYRFGEIAGTTARGLGKIGEGVKKGLQVAGEIADSPLGRAGIVAGIVGLTGGSPLQALTYGANTGMINQANRTKDRIYRNDLINSRKLSLVNNPNWSKLNDKEQNEIMAMVNATQGFKNMNKEQQAAYINNMVADYIKNRQQQQLSDIENEINSVRGYLTDDVYKNMISAQQLRDNAAYRNAYLDAQLQNQNMMNQYRQDQLDRQAKQDAISNYYKSQDLAQGWAKLDMDREKNKNKGNSNNLNAITNQLNRFEASFQNMPNKIESNTLGRLRNVTGFQTKEEANFNSQRQLLFNKIARDLGGEKGVLSDQDIKRIEGALPSYTDSYEQKQAKMSAIYDLLNDRLSVEGVNLQPNTTTTPQLKQKSITVGKYKVRVK
jgi:hypothetical protein